MLFWHPFILINKQATKEGLMMNTCYHHVSWVITQATQHGDLNNVRWCVRACAKPASITSDSSAVLKQKWMIRGKYLRVYNSICPLIFFYYVWSSKQPKNAETVLYYSLNLKRLRNNQNPQVFLILWYISIRPPLTLSCAERVWASREGNATLSRCSNLIKSREFFPPENRLICIQLLSTEHLPSSS